MTVASDDMIAYDTVVFDNMYDSKITTVIILSTCLQRLPKQSMEGDMRVFKHIQHTSDGVEAIK